MKYGLPGPALHPVPPASVGEPRVAHHTEADLPPHRLYPPDEVVPVIPASLDCHEIGYLGDPLLREKAGKEDVRVRKVELFLASPVKNGGDAEPPSFFVVEDRAEDRRGGEGGG